MCYYSSRSQKSQIKPSGLLSCEEFQPRILFLAHSSFQKPPASFGFGSLPLSSKPAARSSNLFLSVQLLHLHIVFLPSWDALEKPVPIRFLILCLWPVFFFFSLRKLSSEVLLWLFNPPWIPWCKIFFINYNEHLVDPSYMKTHAFQFREIVINYFLDIPSTFSLSF